MLSKTEANHMCAGNVQICLQNKSCKSQYLQAASSVYNMGHIQHASDSLNAIQYKKYAGNVNVTNSFKYMHCTSLSIVSEQASRV